MVPSFRLATRCVKITSHSSWPPWPFEALPRSRVVVPISHLPQFSMATNRCSLGGGRYRCIDPCAQQIYSNALITVLVSLLTTSIRQNKHNPQMTSKFPLRSLVPTFPATSALVVTKAPFILDFRHQAVLGIQNLELQTDLLTQRTILSRGYGSCTGLGREVMATVTLTWGTTNYSPLAFRETKLTVYTEPAMNRKQEVERK